MLALKKIKVLIADDHSVVRQGIALLLKEIIKEPIIYHAASYRETLERISTLEKIDFLFLDINFPDGNSTKIVHEIREIMPDIRILIFSALEEEIYALRYLNSGANGFLSKLANDEELRFAVNYFLANGKYISPTIKEKIIENYMHKIPINPLDQLSDRELEIARLLIKGYGNLEISILKDLQKTTVSTYKKRIFEKLNIDNLPALIELFNSYDTEND
ncbi:response regulator transcription factor [Flavobacterium stagni]|uniref:Response regulator transcription factor n=1 Tax=Flavobacterium stagni TaxID=2506421 RepID=A0A4V1N2U2_9FLAO|nr:response regulator transcription factor [Flavobacterium stagni]RXR23414.1 response regulator transcription factor [Flavobacterium stagni]